MQLPTVEYDHDTHLYKVNEEVKNFVSIKSVPVCTTFMIFDE